jgi:hypothetical protein
MVAISRRKLLVVGLVSAGFVATAGNSIPAAAAAKTSALAYHDLWRKLWEDHITWTRVVIMAILDKLAGANAYIDRLLQNPGDMADALAPYYGNAAEVLGDLITDHLVIAAELLVAARDGNTGAFNDAKARWYANADQIAVQMNLMNPRFWPLDETRQMWREHLDATLDEAVDHLTGNFTGEVAAYDLVHELALDMADFFSAGVIRQFPQKFMGNVG